MPKFHRRKVTIIFTHLQGLFFLFLFHFEEKHHISFIKHHFFTSQYIFGEIKKTSISQNRLPLHKENA